MAKRVSAAATSAAFVAAPLARVGHRQLRERLGPVLEEVCASGTAVEIVNRGRPEAVVISHEAFLRLSSADRELGEVRASVALLLAAAGAGAAIPSETLHRLGIVIPLDFDRLQSFQAHFPARVTGDERGQPLPAPAELTLDEFAGEVDEPDEFVEVDD